MELKQTMHNSFFFSTLYTVFLFGACGDSDPAPMDGGGSDAPIAGALTITAPDLDLEGQTLSAHWSSNGGQQGTLRTIAVWPASGSVMFDPATLEAPEEEREDLGDEGTVSFAWFSVEMDDAVLASSPDHMLVEFSQEVVVDSLLGTLFNRTSSLSAGVHLIRVREFTDAEEEEWTACRAANPGDEDACATLQLHVEVVPWAGASLVLTEGDNLPDLG